MFLITLQCSRYMKAMMTLGITFCLKSNGHLLKNQQLWAINTHTPLHMLHYINVSHIYKNHLAPETVIYTQRHPSPVSSQCFLDSRGQKPSEVKPRELTWLTWCTKLSPDSCFIHFRAKMFPSASSVAYWSTSHDPGGDGNNQNAEWWGQATLSLLLCPFLFFFC